MKVFAIVCIVIGVLSFIGAAFAGKSVVGPVFWTVLGLALLKRIFKENMNDNNDKQ